jgi:hypothetical protein
MGKKRKGLKLTTEMLARVYDYLAATEPFIKWNLPDSEDVLFRITKSRTTMGTHRIIDSRHVIEVSQVTITTTASLMSLMAHEMLHTHERHNDCCTTAMHSQAFYRWADEVCEIHGFDRGLF